MRPWFARSESPWPWPGATPGASDLMHPLAPALYTISEQLPVQVALGVLELNTPNMFSNLRAQGGSNHLLAPTALLQQWRYAGAAVGDDPPRAGVDPARGAPGTRGRLDPPG